MADETNLGEVLSNPDDFSWRHSLFMPPDRPWTLETPVLVEDGDDVEEDEDLPRSVVERKFRYVLTMQSVQDIVVNARLQKPSANLAELLAAFVYYFENDAFKAF